MRLPSAAIYTWRRSVSRLCMMCRLGAIPLHPTRRMWHWLPLSACCSSRKPSKQRMACDKCTNEPLAPQSSWRQLMDGGKVLYRIAPADMEAGKGIGCTLCALLQDCVDGIAIESPESVGLEFVLKVRRERKESEVSGPSPKNTPRLRIRPVDRLSLVTEYYLYTSPSTYLTYLLQLTS